MTRTKENYPPNTVATIKALVACHNGLALAYAGRDRVTSPGDVVTAPTDTLLAALPQGSITKAHLVTEGPYAGLIAFTIKDRNERYIELEGLLLLMAFALFETGAIFIDKNNTNEAERKDYPEVFASLGITVPRLLVDAQQGEMVRLVSDHHDLSASNLLVVAGARNITRGRREAIGEALKAYDKNAEEWGLSDHLSRWDYQALIEGCFLLYDLKHGHHRLRVIGEPDAA